VTNARISQDYDFASASLKFPLYSGAEPSIFKALPSSGGSDLSPLVTMNSQPRAESRPCALCVPNRFDSAPRGEREAFN
jgi:hypothetical protein